jgi:hypothetical protein
VPEPLSHIKLANHGNTASAVPQPRDREGFYRGEG